FECPLSAAFAKLSEDAKREEKLMQHNLVAKILSRVKKELAASSNGQILSKIKGEGFDFAELVPYRVGMDARKIYWNSLAKGGDLQLKTFYEEREVNVAVAALLSGSQRFGEPIQKYEKVLESAAMIAFDAVRSGNPFQGIGMCETEDIVTAPAKSPHAVEKYVTALAKIDPLHTQIDPGRVTEKLFKVLRKKSLLVLVSDFLEPYDLRKISRKHEVVAMIVRDRFEREPRALDDTTFHDPETGAEREFWFDAKTAQAYKAAYRKHDKKLLNHFMKCGIASYYLYTDKTLLSALMI
ncbi:MAG: hypothetical protein DSZ05_03625, partial [Sulfurospirillum sp.]